MEIGKSFIGSGIYVRNTGEFPYSMNNAEICILCRYLRLHHDLWTEACVPNANCAEDDERKYKIDNLHEVIEEKFLSYYQKEMVVR